MTDWPDKPFIRIIKGSIWGTPLDGKLAMRTPRGGYGVDTHFLPRNHPLSRIDEWKEVTAVPTAALKRLQDTFRGIDVIESLEPPLLEVLSYLTADKSSALDQAVAKVKDLGETPLILKGFPQDYDLALLLESLAALQAAPRKGLALAKIILVCTTWVDFLSLSDGSLDHVRECVESDPDWGGFTIMVNIAGDVASSIDDGLMAVQKQRLLTIAQYALAWLAELIEKGEA